VLGVPPQSGGVITFMATPLPDAEFSAEDLIESLPGGADFADYIPEQLKDVFEHVVLNYFTVSAQELTTIAHLGFSVGTAPGMQWQVFPSSDVLILENLRLVIDQIGSGQAALTEVSITATAKFLPAIFGKGEFNFLLELEKNSPKWTITTISGRFDGMVPLSQLATGIGLPGANVPQELNDISFGNFGVVVTHQDQGYAYQMFGELDAGFPILETQLTAVVNLNIDKTNADTQVVLRGALAIGEQNFDFELDLSKGDKVLQATWQAEGDRYLEFEDIASAFGFELPEIPKELDLNLKSASLRYDYGATEKVLTLELDSETFGKAAFVALKPKGAQKYEYFFGLHTGSTIYLSDLPLVKWALPSDDALDIQNIQVIIASAALDEKTSGAMNKEIGKLGVDYPTAPEAGMAKGVAFSMEVDIAALSIPIALGTDTESQAGDQTTLAQAEPPPHAETTAPQRGSDGITWFNIQQSFGPVSVQKIGVQYKDGDIFVLVNLSLTASELTIGLIELGIGNPISTFDPKFTIHGIEVDFQAGPVGISGGLLGTLEPLAFTGELMLETELLTIGAVGGYAEVQDHPSLFLFSVLDYPIGGPSYFFVTGLAAGFGFNRSLLIPDVDGVATFPFVQWATGGEGTPDPAATAEEVLSGLAETGVVTPKLGEDWLAAGIRFTSFELVDSFALVTVSFGRNFELDLLGLSTLEIPQGEPVAEAQLEIKATVDPSEGLFSLAGQLTRNSYVLSRAARLTGDFAFYLWFGGEHEGDFVISLGGYSPHFDVPDYYPKVPRLRLNWQLDSSVVISGDLYFALTSNAVMAGGGLSAVWHGGPVRAWFDVEADFLLVFKPFHYCISAGIHLGASFTIDLLFTKLHLTIHVGVDLSLWGPDFQGKARVDLDIISFTIHFGSGGTDSSTTIGFDDFVRDLLPKKKKKPATIRSTALAVESLLQLDATPPDPVADASVVNIQVIGLDKTVKTEEGTLYVVSPTKFEVKTHSVIPSKSDPVFTGSNMTMNLITTGLKTTGGQPLQWSDVNTSFGIGPTGTASDQLTSAQYIQLVAEEEGETVEVQPIIGNGSKALFEKKDFDSQGVPKLSSSAVKDSTVTNVVTGYRLVPIPPKERRSLPIPIEYLKYTVDENLQGFAWSKPVIPTNDPFSTSDTVYGTIATTKATANRSALLKAIPEGLLAGPANVDVSSLASPSTYYLRCEPHNRLLGEDKP